MQNPTDQTEATIPTETTVNRAGKLCRKVAKRTRPFELAAEELDLVPSSVPHAEQKPPASKKPRLEEPCFSASTDEVATEISTHGTVASLTAPTDVSVGLPHPPTADGNANASIWATRRRWTSEEDAKLTSAVANTSKTKRSGEYKISWAAVAALVPSRTNVQCWHRWNKVLDPSIDQTPTGRTGAWTADEDIKLKAAVLTHGGKNWAAIAALVPGRTRAQCSTRWKYVLVSNIDPANGRKGKWTEDENIKLKDAVQTYGGKDWAAIAALVPGRTKIQCQNTWKDVLDPSIDRASGSKGKWTADEDKKLRDAVQTHGGKNWVAISALVHSRTKNQCLARWHIGLKPNINPTTARAGKWAADEDSKLEKAVQTHGSKNWAVIAPLVPGRTKTQCCSRWHDGLKPKIDPTTARVGKWTAVEDSSLKDAVQEHGGKDWDAINALVPGRTKTQCNNRWHQTLKPKIDRASGPTGT
jgi:hypothetical protein